MNTKRDIVAFVNTNVIPMDRERVLANQTALVEGGQITAVGAADEVLVPDGARVIDGRDAYLMPGLADMHMHFVNIIQTFAGPEQLHLYLAQGVTTIRNLSAMPEHLAWAQEVARGERLGPSLYNGRMVVGLPQNLKSIARNFRLLLIFGPLVLGLIGWLLIAAVLALTGNVAQLAGWWWLILISLGFLLLLGGAIAWLKIIPLNVFTSRQFPFATIAETAAEARRYVRQIKQEGYDFVKLYDWLPIEAYLAGADEARKQGIYAIGHMLDELPLQAIFEGGLREVAHMDEFMEPLMIGEASPNQGFNEVTFDYEAIPKAAALAKAHDVLVVSNMVADETVYQLLQDPARGLAQEKYNIVSTAVKQTWLYEGRLVNWRDQAAWRRDVLQPFLLRMAGGLHEAGVPLLVGTDVAVEGLLPEHIHRDLELLVEAGLSPYEALKAGTKNAADSVRRMGGQGDFGTIAVGRRADLILLEKDPLENISHIRRRLGVMVNGRWYTQAELDKLVQNYVDKNQKS